MSSHCELMLIDEPATALAWPTAIDSESLGLHVEKAVLGVCSKLADLKPYIEELWRRFDNLKRDEQIYGCRYKKEFCNKVLRRSPRAVQYLIYGRPESKPNPEANDVRSSAPERKGGDSQSTKMALMMVTERYEDGANTHCTDHGDNVPLRIDVTEAFRADLVPVLQADCGPEALLGVGSSQYSTHVSHLPSGVFRLAELVPVTPARSDCVISVAAFVSLTGPLGVFIGCPESTRERLPSKGSVVNWHHSERFAIATGDAREIVTSLPFPVDCIVSSPPYFAQRTYGDSAKELGKEDSVDAYVSRLADLFAAIPLQPWASIWVNIGDKRRKDGGLLHVPERFLFAMEARGFALVDKVVWAKEVTPVQGPPLGHAMIEPAPGRLNGNGHEPFYRFVRDTKSAWTDTCAVRISRRNVKDNRYLPESLMECDSSVEGRNLNNVWLVPMGQTKRNHYAVFPSALVERPIAMTCPPAVTELGPRDRIIEMVAYDDGQPMRRVGKYTKSDSVEMSGRQDTGRAYVPRKPVTRGWTLSGLPSRPGIVLDPFAGTGTTGEVAIKLGRLFIGIELYEQNAKMALERCQNATRSYECHLEDFAADPHFTNTTGIVVPPSNAASGFSVASLTGPTSNSLSYQLPVVIAVGEPAELAVNLG